METNPYRELPSVDELVADLDAALPRALLVELARETLDITRTKIKNGSAPEVHRDFSALIAATTRQRGVPVLNASGVLLHTNLGRAPWTETAVQAAGKVAKGYSNVELDVDTGARNRRGGYVTRLLSMLTGAEDALVVNNNAAALFLCLSALAAGRAVPVARGEMIEIGGSYRLPDVMEASRARLVEVGTTNRVRVGDFQVGLQTHDCGAILKVHPSNYQVVGFTESPSVADLRTVAGDLPIVFDVGSGLLDATAAWVPGWLRDEPAVRQSLHEGADVVLFSGDKLLGGPQAGIIVGKTDFINRLRASAVSRALRVDGVTYAALAATLEAYADGSPPSIPFWNFALTSNDDLAKRITPIAQATGGMVEEGATAVGGGSAPGVEIPSPVIRYSGKQSWFTALLAQTTPVLARRDGGDLIVDIRSVPEAMDKVLTDSLRACR